MLSIPNKLYGRLMAGWLFSGTSWPHSRNEKMKICRRAAKKIGWQIDRTHRFHLEDNTFWLRDYWFKWPYYGR